MMMTQKTRSTRYSRPRKSKIADSIRHHENTEIRLMAIFLEDAMNHAKKGDIVRMMANLRNAHEYEQSIPTLLKLELYANG